MRMKRVVGTLLAAAILASGLTLAEASPSSAAKRNPCMDQAHWATLMAYYESTAQQAFYQWMDFVTAQFNPSSAEWIVNPGGSGVYFHMSIPEYLLGLDSRWQSWANAVADQEDFGNNVSAC
jgi:hypothetical protein